MPINYAIEYPKLIKRIAELEAENKRLREALKSWDVEFSKEGE